MLKRKRKRGPIFRNCGKMRRTSFTEPENLAGKNETQNSTFMRIKH